MEKFKNIFWFAPKSTIKAGEGLEKGRFPFYTSSSIQSKWIDTEQHFDEALIFGTGGSASIHYESQPFSTSTDCFVTITTRKDVNTKYVYYFLSSNIHLLERGFKGAGLKHLSKAFLEEIEIPLPDLETQNKIVAILDKAKAILDKREQTIKKYDELLRATFLDMFGDPVNNEKGWGTSHLKEISKVRIGPFGSLLHQEDYIKDGTPIVNPSHISDGKIVVDWDLTVSNEKLKELSAYIMITGDIVLGRRGEIGRCAVVTENENGFLCGTGSIFIRPNDTILSVFLYNAISTNSIKRVLEHSAKGVTMKNLNSGIVEDLKIPTPPLSLQRKFVTIIERIETLKAILITSKRKIENLVGGLSQKAFKGELDFNAAVDLEVLLENDYDFFKENSNSNSIKLLLERLNTDELNENKFNEQQAYDKAKSFVFELIKNGKVKQVFDDKTKKVKLTV